MRLGKADMRMGDRIRQIQIIMCYRRDKNNYVLYYFPIQITTTAQTVDSKCEKTAHRYVVKLFVNLLEKNILRSTHIHIYKPYG